MVSLPCLTGQSRIPGECLLDRPVNPPIKSGEGDDSLDGEAPSRRVKPLAKLSACIMAKLITPRWGWALTGSGHFFKECLAMIAGLQNVDLFVSKAAAEVVRMYRQQFNLPKSARIIRDTTASAAPVGL